MFQAAGDPGAIESFKKRTCGGDHLAGLPAIEPFFQPAALRCRAEIHARGVIHGDFEFAQLRADDGAGFADRVKPVAAGAVGHGFRRGQGFAPDLFQPVHIAPLEINGEQRLIIQIEQIGAELLQLIGAFDVAGKKLTNARFNSVYLNGLLIHENVELLGVTRGSISPQEVAKAPFRIQGDHGQVAFKNIVYEVFEKSDISFTPVTFEVSEGVVNNFKQTNPKIVASGTIPQVTQKIINAKRDFLAKFQGKFTTKVADNYTFIGQWEAIGAVVVDNDTVIQGWHQPFEYVKGRKKLAVGEHTYTILYTKDYNWRPNSLGVFIQKDQWEKQNITERTSLLDMVPVPLIEVKPTDQPSVQRSFIMYGNNFYFFITY